MKKDIKRAQASLDEMLKRIKPYMPKIPKSKPAPKANWELSRNDSFPPPKSPTNRSF